MAYLKKINYHCTDNPLPEYRNNALYIDWLILRLFDSTVTTDEVI